MKNEKIFITGGAGYLGRKLIEKLHGENEITVYSRDESKHYYMRKHYPDVNFIVGDIRNRDLLTRKSKGHTIGIFAASLKQIEACVDNYEEAAGIIINGAFNSRIAAEENGFKSACFISSDKSRAATTLYGAMKYVAGEGFIAGKSNVKLTTAVYGNVTNSTGSIIPLIWNYIANQKALPLYSSEMTRFIFDVSSAIDLIIKSVKYQNCNLIPSARSFKIKDLFEIYKKEFGLAYYISEPRAGEKIHEIMASNEEIRRMEFIPEDNLYLMHPQKNINKLHFTNNEYSSRDCTLSRDELYDILKSKKFYKP
ncbi:NAD-dependent epimerase/dehydratase family protein [Candidatus Parcubacteria bacterium]|jgi:UDP-glucose 4-epimerase|nr:MAG: NAD-dependent epimerase/dehydratase family protein [Candidatus Parcubacteria bacterium]